MRLNPDDANNLIASSWFVADSLLPLSEVRGRESAPDGYLDAIEWIDDFVIQPNLELNRAGAVCPRLAPTMRRDLLWFVSMRVPDPDPRSAFSAGLELTALYSRLFSEPAQLRGGSLLAFFPELPMTHAAEFIDGGHRSLRMDFVRRGLMLGEFHPASLVMSVRNQQFPVMRCPVPMYAVRALTVHDLMFLDQPAEDPVRRLEYLEQFVHHVGAEVPPAMREAVKSTIEQLKARV